MSTGANPALSERQSEILAVLRAEDRKVRAGLVGLRMKRPRPSTASIAGTLRGLRLRGLVEKTFDPGWNGDQWSLTGAGREVAPDRCRTCGLINPGPEHSSYEPMLCSDKALAR